MVVASPGVMVVLLRYEWNILRIVEVDYYKWMKWKGGERKCKKYHHPQRVVMCRNLWGSNYERPIVHHQEVEGFQPRRIRVYQKILLS